jgi:hypothetical protein
VALLERVDHLHGGQRAVLDGQVHQAIAIEHGFPFVPPAVLQAVELAVNLSWD